MSPVWSCLSSNTQGCSWMSGYDETFRFGHATRRTRIEITRWSSSAGAGEARRGTPTRRLERLQSGGSGVLAVGGYLSLVRFRVASHTVRGQDGASPEVGRGKDHRTTAANGTAARLQSSRRPHHAEPVDGDSHAADLPGFPALLVDYSRQTRKGPAIHFDGTVHPPKWTVDRHDNGPVGTSSVARPRIPSAFGARRRRRRGRRSHGGGIRDGAGRGS
jgi:hypothetical protein